MKLPLALDDVPKHQLDASGLGLLGGEHLSKAALVGKHAKASVVRETIEAHGSVAILGAYATRLAALVRRPRQRHKRAIQRAQIERAFLSSNELEIRLGISVAAGPAGVEVQAASELDNTTGVHEHVLQATARSKFEPDGSLVHGVA